MPQGTFIADGLWYCLCPRFSHLSFQQLFTSCIPRRQPLFRPCRTHWVARTSGQRRYRANANGDENNDVKDIQRCTNSAGGRPLVVFRRNGQDDNPPKPKFLRGVVRRLAGKTFGVPGHLQQRSTSDLENMLQDLTAKSPSMMAATAILRILIRDRHVRPEARHYKALILSNTDGKHGSPDNVCELLKEMEENNIPADSGTLHAALQVGRYLPCPTGLRLTSSPV
jgi:hypothetical protein